MRHRLVLAAAITAALLLTVSAPANAAVPTHDCAKASPRTTAKGVLCHMNFARALFGLPPLRADRRLARAALRQGRAIVRTGRLSHNVAGSLPGRVRAARYRFRRASETLWYARGRRVSAAMAVPGWLGSAGHRATLLGPYRDVGVAVVGRAPGGRAGRTVVAVYGTR